MTTPKAIILRQYESESGAAYLELHDHPHVETPGLVKRSVDIHSLIGDYPGPRITIDFDGRGVPVGIEILYPSDEDDPA